MSTVLYRKYRPKSFKDLKGQDHIKNILVQSIKDETYAHGYLFAGPRGTGKTSAARLFAKAINCTTFKDDIDENCDNCEHIDSGTSIDIIEIDAASNRGIEEIRTLRENVNFYPSVLKKKVYIIDEAHMLTEAAFNALLKTLEEPPDHVVFILATTEPTKIPVTILSRVQRFDFRLAYRDVLVEKLKDIAKDMKIEIEEKAMELIFRMSGGSFREAESLLGKIVSEVSGKVTEEKVREMLGVISVETLNELTEYLVDEKLDEALTLFREIAAESNEIGGFVDQLMDFLAEYLLKEGLDTYQRERLIHIVNETINLKRDLKLFHNKEKLVEYYFVKMCEGADKGPHPSQPSTPPPRNRGQASPKKEKEKQESSSVARKTLGESKQKNLTEKKFSEQEKPKAKSTPSLSFNADRLISEVKKEEIRLAAFLEDTEMEMNDGILTVANGNSFHLKYIEKDSNRKLITKLVNKLFGEKIQIKTELREVEESATPKEVKAKSVKENLEIKSEEEPKKVQTDDNDLPFVFEEGDEEKLKQEEEQMSFDNSDLVEKYL